MTDDTTRRDIRDIRDSWVIGGDPNYGYSAAYYDQEGYGMVGIWQRTWEELLVKLASRNADGTVRENFPVNTNVRYHSSDDMDGLGELDTVTEPVAVVLRKDGSVDVYGYIAVVDQRATRTRRVTRAMP